MDVQTNIVPQPFVVGRIEFENRGAAAAVLGQLDTLLMEVEKATPYAKVSPVAHKLEQEILAQFDTTTQRVVRKGVATLRKGTGAMDKKEVQRFMSVVGKEYAKFSPAVQKQVLTAVGAIYDIQRKAMAKGLKIKPTFKLIDKQAKAFMAKDQMWWIGDFYDSSLSNVLNKRVSQVMLEQGLGRADAAKELQKTLHKDIMAGRLPAKVGVPPPGWNSTPQAYFEGLTGNMASRASGWSALESMVDAAVERYRIAAVLDSRTSDVCRTMNGKVFTTAQGTSLRDRIMAAKSPDDIKKIAGWQRADEITSKYGVKRGKALTPKQASTMASAGLALPPYHFRCRSTVLPA